jgi:hypothetical protein
MAVCAGGSVGSTPLWHALIRYPQRHQHITLAYPQQLFAARSQVSTRAPIGIIRPTIAPKSLRDY